MNANGKNVLLDANGRNLFEFDNYDLNKLKKAHQLLNEVYEYNYGDSKLKRKVNRLKTIISRLDILLNVE